MSDQLRGHGGHVRRVSAPRRVRADLEAENARLQERVEEAQEEIERLRTALNQDGHVLEFREDG
ncbi:hypothetical protein LCGC14_2478160, partial [marine sediment metagenome]